jgi:hypothetical protein
MISLEEGAAPQKSPKELQVEFIENLERIRDYWMAEDRVPETLGKVEGVIFSILVLIDGMACDGGPFPLYAITGDDEPLVAIWGGLHDEWGARQRAKRKNTQTEGPAESGPLNPVKTYE